MKPVYLDYAASTPVDPSVLEAMLPYLQYDDGFGNPSSKHHSYGKTAKHAIETARAQVAELIHATPDSIVFTSCATESINTALKGIMAFHHRRGNHIITVKTEHKAVLKTCEALERTGCDLTYLTPKSNGLIDLADLKAAFTDKTVLVSVMHINNEFGAVQDIQAIAEWVKSQGAFMHVDAVQSAGKLPIDVRTLPVDLLSFSGHKVYAPKGIGVLYLRQDPKVRLTPLLHGAGQENQWRSGTLATHQIVGIGKAFELAKHYLPNATAHYQHCRDTLLQGLQAYTGWQLNGDVQTCHPSIVNLSFEHFSSQDIVKNCPTLALSTGAACATEALEPSYVLSAIGVPTQLATNAIRLSFGRETSVSDIQQAITAFAGLLS